MGADQGAQWHSTGTLHTLRLLLEAAVEVRHTVCRRTGLSEVELATLEQLSHGSVGPAALARRLAVTSAAATGIVDRLHGRGHVERSADPHDRRRTQLHLTESGRQEMRRQLMPMFAGLAQVDAGFTDEERAVVERYLRGALASVERVIGEGPEQAPGVGPGATRGGSPGERPDAS